MLVCQSMWSLRKTFITACMAGFPALASAHSVGSIEKVNPTQVRPTQGVVGIEWVIRKVIKLSALSGDELDRRLRADPAPAVWGPGRQLWLVDGHHEFRALAELGVRTAYVEIVADFANLSWKEFVNEMTARAWFYLGDRDGVWTYRPETLPQSILELEDDPYRSFASFLRAEGGFRKTHISFAEFQWSNALRFINTELIFKNPPAALALAHEFARSDRAAGLPGNLVCENYLKGP